MFAAGPGRNYARGGYRSGRTRNQGNESEKHSTGPGAACCSVMNVGASEAHSSDSPTLSSARSVSMNFLLRGLAAVTLVALVGCNQDSTSKSSESSTSTTASTVGGSTTGSQPSAVAPSAGAVRTTAQGLKIEEVVVGTGAIATKGKMVSVHYTGWLSTKTKDDPFDTSYKTGQPYEFPLGAGQVIQGWDEGVEGMKVGGKRHLTIPPALGYGPNDYGPIPGNSTLIFDVELMGVR